MLSFLQRPVRESHCHGRQLQGTEPHQPMNPENDHTSKNDRVPATEDDLISNQGIRRRSLSPLREFESRSDEHVRSPKASRHSLAGIRHSKNANSEETFKERRQWDLDASRPLRERVKAAEDIIREIYLYSADVLSHLWPAIKSLATESTSFEAREAGFAILKAYASHSGLSPGDREILYSMIVTPLQASEASLQLSALDRLTNNGQYLFPFEAELIVFLNASLRDLFEAAQSARELHFGPNSARKETSSHFESKRIVDESILTGSGNSDSRKDITGKGKDHLGEEKSLLRVFYLIADIIAYNPQAFHDTQLEILVDQVIRISSKSKTRADLHGVVKILHAITSHADIPTASLEATIQMLSTILGMANMKFEEETCKCLHNILRSSHQVTATNILLRTFTGPPDSTTKYRGSLLTLKLIAEDKDLGGLLMNESRSLAFSLQQAGFFSDQLKLAALQTINTILNNDTIVSSFVQADWKFLIDIMDGLVAVQLMTRTREDSIVRLRNTVKPSSPFYKYIIGVNKTEGSIQEESAASLRLIAERVSLLSGSYWKSIDQQKASILARFLVHTAFYVPSVWECAVQFMWDRGLLSPPNDNWMPHLWILLDCVLGNHTHSESLRCLVLHICGQLYPLLQEARMSTKNYGECLRFACEVIKSEEVVPASIVNSLADIMVQCGPDADMETFDILIGTIDHASNASSLDPAVSAKIPDCTADCLIKLFLRTLPESSYKTCKVYKILLNIAGSPKPTKIRLSVMKLLARLRCNSKYLIETVALPDSLGLAATLCRTEATASGQVSLQASSNRMSALEEPPPTRTGRSSVVETARPLRSRSATRSASLRDRSSRPNLPLWMYDSSEKGLPEEPPKKTNLVVYSDAAKKDKLEGHWPKNPLHPGLWLDIVIELLEKGCDWELYSYILVHLPSQLSNRSLFAHNKVQILTIQGLVVKQLEEGSFHEPPPSTGIKKGDVALCLYQTLTMLISYHPYGRRESDNMVRVFLAGVDKWDRAGKCCIHALSLCCHEMPSYIEKNLFYITHSLQQKITRSDLAMDILEFLGGLARLPDAWSIFSTVDDNKASKANTHKFFQTIFGICIRYLQYARDERQKVSGDVHIKTKTLSNRQSSHSGEVGRAPDSLQASGVQSNLLEYVYALAYHVITSWFLSIELGQRAQHVGWIAKELAWKDESGKEVMEEQSQVILDMMHRTAYSDLGETKPDDGIIAPGDNILKRTWLVGMSIISVEVPRNGGVGQIIKRQASGTTHASYRHNTARLPDHHVRSPHNSNGSDQQGLSDLYPNHLFLQLFSTIAPVPTPMQPIILPDDEFTKRALRSFDLTDTVDGHKAGVVYIGHGQCSEAEILANSGGSDAYDNFLSGLGTQIELKDANLNTQGLDRSSNIDGTHTYAWRDRVTEIVFHVATMMPTDTRNDPQGVNKKRHIGNDHVKIIFNNSDRQFDFDTFASDMNDVNIVITPEVQTRADKLVIAKKIDGGSQDQRSSLTESFGFYKVQTLCSSSLPRLSPAASTKVISASALPGFIRQLALSASVFCQVWFSLGGGEYVSSWRTRLREIMRLRQKYANTGTSASLSYPMPASPRSYVEGDSWYVSPKF